MSNLLQPALSPQLETAGTAPPSENRRAFERSTREFIRRLANAERTDHDQIEDFVTQLAELCDKYIATVSSTHVAAAEEIARAATASSAQAHAGAAAISEINKRLQTAFDSMYETSCANAATAKVATERADKAVAAAAEANARASALAAACAVSRQTKPLIVSIQLWNLRVVNVHNGASQTSDPRLDMCVPRLLSIASFSDLYRQVQIEYAAASDSTGLRHFTLHYLNSEQNDNWFQNLKAVHNETDLAEYTKARGSDFQNWAPLLVWFDPSPLHFWPTSRRDHVYLEDFRVASSSSSRSTEESEPSGDSSSSHSE
jgi:hypothetical protein